MSKLFENLKDPQAKQKTQDFRIEIARDFEKLQSEKNKAYWYLMKRISDLRDVAHYNLMLTAGEPIGGHWKAKLVAYDEILNIPDECQQKAVNAETTENLTSVV